MTEDKKPTRKICSGCAEELTAGGYRITYPKGAQLHMNACFYCGKRLPVHDAWIAAAHRKKKQKSEG